MFESETETTDLRIIEWETRIKCCEKYRMEITESKAMGSIMRGGGLGLKKQCGEGYVPGSDRLAWKELR